MNCTIRVVKTKALISFAVTAKLICAFVFAYADCWFCHEAAHLFISQMYRNTISENNASEINNELCSFILLLT